MKSRLSPLYLLSALIVSVFALSSVYPTLRILVLGGKPISGLPNTIFAFFPDLLFLVTFGYALFLFFTKREFRFQWQGFDTVVSLYLVFNLVYGYVLSNNTTLALLSVRITYLPVALYFVARLLNAQAVTLNKRLLHSVFLLYAGIALLGLLIYFVFPSVQAKLISVSGYESPRYFIIRMCSLYLTPILFAFVMAFSAIYFYLRSLKNISVGDSICFLMLWTCLVLTVSRGAIMSFGLAFVIISLIYKNYKTSLVLGMGMSLIILSVSFYATRNLDFLQWMFYSSSKTVNMDKDLARVNRWQTTFDDFKKQPWGYGLGNSGAVAFTHLINKKDAKAAVYSTDGWYLKMACENGVLGLLSYLLLAGSFLRQVIKKIRTNSDELALLALGVFIIVSIQSIFSNSLDFHPEISLFWLIAGLAMNTYTKNVS